MAQTTTRRTQARISRQQGKEQTCEAKQARDPQLSIRPRHGSGRLGTEGPEDDNDDDEEGEKGVDRRAFSLRRMGKIRKATAPAMDAHPKRCGCAWIAARRFDLPHPL